MKLDCGKWWVEVCWNWRVFCIGVQPKWSFKHELTWYDGPHRLIDFGPFAIYLNW